MWINFLFFLIHIVTSSHFYGGTITWRIQDATNTSQIAISISQTYAWTYTVAPCDTVAIATKKAVTVSAGTLVCTLTCPSKFGPVSTMGTCVDGSSLNNIGVGQRSDVAKAPENSSFVLIYKGSAWGGLTIAAGGWSILSKIDLVRRPDNQLFNNAPVAIVISPINIEFNKTTTITISVSDPDGDDLRCRWAIKSKTDDDECNTICPPNSLPIGTNLSSDCTIQIKGTILNSRYAVAIMIEDFVNSTSMTPLSAVPLQFLVQVITPTKCPSPPSILYNGSSCTPIQVGQTFTGQFFGTTNCTSPTTIAEIATVSFPGMNQGRLVQVNSQISSRSFNWTATLDHLGYQVMCALTVDSNKLQSPQLCLTFYVTVNGSSSCPGKTMSTDTTTPFALPSVTPSLTTYKTSTSKCVTWPYYSTLSGLGALALCCNCCLLCRYFGCGAGGYQRRTYRERSSHNSDRPIVPRISLVHSQRTNSLSRAESDVSQRSNNVSPSYTIAINRVSQLPSENSNLSSISEEFDTDRLITTVWNQR